MLNPHGGNGAYEGRLEIIELYVSVSETPNNDKPISSTIATRTIIIANSITDYPLEKDEDSIVRSYEL